jgi:Spy/CpxP family protein refolding chaperone
MPTGLARYMIESMPNVTEKQKKAFSDLMLKQQDEMKKFREETAAKMQSMRDSHRKNMMNLLTDEQKKFVESKQGNTNAAPAKGK